MFFYNKSGIFRLFGIGSFFFQPFVRRRQFFRIFDEQSGE